MKSRMPGEFGKQSECSKRAWVAKNLSDDDAGASATAAARAHVKQCASCRELADSISNVSEGLAKLAATDPDAAFAAQANAQLDRALASGGALTGRVARFSDESFTEAIPKAPFRWVGYGSLAAAAVVIFSVGVYIIASGYSTARPGLVTQVQPGPPGSIAETPLPPDRIDVADALVETRPQQAEPVQVETERVVVARTREVGPRRDRTRPEICRHRTHLEAALCPRANGIHSAMIVPRQRPPSP